MDRVPAGLSSFFIYNPLYGPTDETEHEKLLFYYPPDTPLDQKLKYVGLSEAMVNFTRTFSPHQPCESVHTQKRRMIFYNPEPNFWLIMHISLPYVKKDSKEGNQTFEYLENDIQDSTLHAVLHQTYRSFKLFHSPMESIIQKFSVKILRHKLEEFYPQYLSQINWDSVDLMNTLDGIHFLPLDKTLYLKVQSFINMTENLFSDITYSCFLFNYHLVWSGLNQEDIRTLYRYLTSGFLEGSLNPLLAAEAGSSKKSGSMRHPPPSRTPRSGFMIGPEDLSDNDSPINVPKVFLGPQNTPHYLIAFQMDDVTVVFLLECLESASSKVTDLGFYSKLESFLKLHLEDLSKQMAKQYSKTLKSVNDNVYRYIYFNHMNLALKTTIEGIRPSISREIWNILTDMHDDFNEKAENLSEICAKSATDVWVVGRKVDHREFYVIINKKDATLIDIQDEVKKLSQTQFNNIFID